MKILKFFFVFCFIFSFIFLFVPEFDSIFAVCKGNGSACDTNASGEDNRCCSNNCVTYNGAVSYGTCQSPQAVSPTNAPRGLNNCPTVCNSLQDEEYCGGGWEENAGRTETANCDQNHTGCTWHQCLNPGQHRMVCKAINCPSGQTCSNNVCSAPAAPAPASSSSSSSSTSTSSSSSSSIQATTPNIYNLIINPGFENGMDSWTDPDTFAAIITTPTTDIHTGSKSLKVFTNGTNKSAQKVQWIPNQGVKTYTLSGWGKKVGTGVASIQIDEWNLADAAHPVFKGSHVLTFGSSWEQIFTTFTTDASTTHIPVIVRSGENTTTAQAATTIFVDDLSLIRTTSSSSSSSSANTACVCNSPSLSTGTCSSQCTFDKYTDGSVSYSATMSCIISTALQISTPTSDQKNAFCRANLRTKGDADENGTINRTDYLYYVSAVSGGKIPPNVNPDFNGDGEVGSNDRAIVVKTLNTP
ncbi:MAG: hypothetical protein Q7R33_02465 [Nitrosarchaeum sp.]|nr:hypothetical protein [Nitrosarchaeum sp.]